MEMQACPCGSGRSFKDCCDPLLKGLKKAASPRELLQARYTAFVVGEIDYIFKTHHPEKVQEVQRSTVEDWAKNSEWLGLTIRDVTATADPHQILIEFVAKYRSLDTNEVTDHHEISLFKKEKDEWFFFDVVKFKVKPFKRDEPKLGRNDPCSCGSQKKFKKCCGKEALA